MTARRGKGTIILIALLIVAAAAAALWLCARKPPAPAVQAITIRRSTAPASQPAATQVSPVPRNLLSVIRADDSRYPTTRELDVPTDFDQAAHIILHEPVYLGPAGDLWITHPRSMPAMDVIQNLGDENSHAVRERVLYAHWQTSGGRQSVALICGEGHDEIHLIEAGKDVALAVHRAYRWDDAVSLNHYIIVPWDGGVTAIDLNDPAHPIDQTLIDTTPPPGVKLSSPVILFDTQGVIAWMPWENGLTGSRGAARFVNGKWIRLDASKGWPEKILHLVPLLDGSILQLIGNDDGSIKLGMSGFEKSATPANAQQIEQLVTQLSDPDPTNRDAAYEQLTRFGPGIFPILQRLEDNQPPSAKNRIAELLRSQMKLTLGPITLNDGPVTTAARLRDGGVVLYCDGGVSIARGSADQPNIISPAWLSIRPGYPIQVLPTNFVHDLQPQKERLFASKNDWIVGDDANGLRWFVGNHFEPLQRKSERRFSEFAGVDAHGRWIMKTPDPAGPTLIIDPNLPDTTPRLPAWEFSAAGGSAGWTNTNWPAAKKTGTFVLDATGWRNLDANERLITRASDVSPTTLPATTHSTTEPSDLILIDNDGTRYFDGSKTIRIAPKTGPILTWNLPPAAVGNGDVWLFHCGQDRFFLFNQPGRVLRLRRTSGGAEPFVLEATFTRHIPNVDPERIWLDPAGRIDIAFGGDTLVILFPTGRVPPEIQQLMPVEPDEE